MFKKDYIVRQLEEFGKVLSVIWSFKKEKDWEAFENEIKATVMRFTRLELEYVENLSLEEFDRTVVGSLSIEQTKILAALLYEKLDVYVMLNLEERIGDAKRKCLKLYHAIADQQSHNEFNLDVHYKIACLQRL